MILEWNFFKKPERIQQQTRADANFFCIWLWNLRCVHRQKGHHIQWRTKQAYSLCIQWSESTVQLPRMAHEKLLGPTFLSLVIQSILMLVSILSIQMSYLFLKSKWSRDTQRTIEVLSFKDQYKNGLRSIENSLVFTVVLNDVNKSQEDSPIETTIIGWERNEKNQLQPRIVDMSKSMNTEKLAESAVSLNLKLMKWRIMPNIDLDVIRNQKCLLLGSGTLGCNVARCLMVFWKTSIILKGVSASAHN